MPVKRTEGNQLPFFLRSPSVIPPAVNAAEPVGERLILCNGFTGDSPTRPTLIFQWVSVSLTLAQRVRRWMFVFSQSPIAHSLQPTLFLLTPAFIRSTFIFWKKDSRGRGSKGSSETGQLNKSNQPTNKTVFFLPSPLAPRLSPVLLASLLL